MSDPLAVPDNGRREPPWKLIALGAVVVAILIFFLQNRDDSSVSFLWADFTWPLWAVIGISILLGVALDRLASWQWRRSRRRRDDTVS